MEDNELAISYEQLDLSANISSDAGHFFQSDADLARIAAREGMVNFDKGQAIKVSSKILDMCPGYRIRSGAAAATVSTAEEHLESSSSPSSTSGTNPIVVDDPSVLGATMYLAESGHIARKINLETGKTIKIYQGHMGPVTRVVVYKTHLGQERLVTGSWDKTIKVWDADTKKCLATLKGHTDFVKALALRTVLVRDVGEDKEPFVGFELFSSSYDGTILHWDLQTFEPFRNRQGNVGVPWKGHSRGVNDLCLAIEDDNEEAKDWEESNPSGREYLYSSGSDGTIRKWDIIAGQGRGGHCVHVFDHHATTIYRLVITGGEIWSVSADKTAQRLDLETKKVDTTLEHPDFVKSIALAGPYVVTGGRHESIRVWSVATGKLIKEIKGHFDEVSVMVIIGSTLFTGSLDGTLRRWSLKEQDLLKSDKDDASEEASKTKEATAEPIPSDASKPLMAQPQVKETSIAQSNVPTTVNSKMMTEDEERELAELMSDDD